MTQPLKLVFMGTPEFALPALNALVEAGHNVVAVYTQPPRPAGRGQKERPSPIDARATELGLPVYTPITLKKKSVQEQFRNHGADAAVVAAYGLLLPAPILEAYPHGCINIHPSALPRWRGAAPLQRTLMAGDTHTSICIMQMDSGLDTGDILLSQGIPIPTDMTAGELHDETAKIGATLLVETLQQLQAGKLMSQKQSAEGITYAHKIGKEEARIDWTKPAAEVHNHIRGLSPFPGAYFVYRGESIKVLHARMDKDQSQLSSAGTVLNDTLSIACGQGSITPLLIQRPGKRPMSTGDMLRGYPIPKGTVLE